MKAEPSTLFDVATFVAPPREGTIQQRFEAFHSLNPWVFDALRKLAFDMLGRGRPRIGVKMLFEVVRWEYHRQTSDPSSEFRLNNNWTSRYARMLIEAEPALADAIQLRELRAA